MENDNVINFNNKSYNMYRLKNSIGNSVAIGTEELDDLIKCVLDDKDNKTYSKEDQQYISDLDDMVYAFLPKELLETRSEKECNDYFLEFFD